MRVQVRLLVYLVLPLLVFLIAGEADCEESYAVQELTEETLTKPRVLAERILDNLPEAREEPCEQLLSIQVLNFDFDGGVVEYQLENRTDEQITAWRLRRITRFADGDERSSLKDEIRLESTDNERTGRGAIMPGEIHKLSEPMGHSDQIDLAVPPVEFECFGIVLADLSYSGSPDFAASVFAYRLGVVTESKRIEGMLEKTNAALLNENELETHIQKALQALHDDVPPRSGGTIDAAFVSGVSVVRDNANTFLSSLIARTDGNSSAVVERLESIIQFTKAETNRFRSGLPPKLFENASGEEHQHEQ